MAWQILIVDDDELSLAATHTLLSSRGYLAETATNGDEAIEKVRSEPSRYSLVLLDYRMDGRDGAATAQAILSIQPSLYVLMHSADESREALKSSWRAGAVGFIDKAEPAESLLHSVEKFCQRYEENFLTVTPPTTMSDDEQIIASIGLVGRSRLMADLALRVKRYAGKRDNVLILGETGTGKEKIARALHQQEPNRFFAVNCAAYNGNADLMESDIFGHLRGAFTGATRDHVGIFEAARDGTVFLDEIHTLDLKAQQKLLRAIQDRTVRPLGSTREYRVEFRLIAAAKPDLEQRTLDGAFLPDLFERLNVLTLNIPSLRERPSDIEPLVLHFCRQYEQETGERRCFLMRTLRYLESYSWPRNVRELENTVRRLCVDSEKERITPEQLDEKYFGGGEKQTGVKVRLDKLLQSEIEDAARSSTSQREAARKLGIPETTFRRLLRRFGVRGSDGE